ncbi:hypothetical protein GCM10027447_34820 [Glycomyces halotolerans]
MDYSKQLTLSEYLALPLSTEEVAERIGAELALRLPDEITVEAVSYERGGYVADCDGIESVLDMIDIAAALGTGLTLMARGDRQFAALHCRLSGERVVIRAQFGLPEYSEVGHG